MSAKKPNNGSFVKNGVTFNFENEELYHYQAFTQGNISGEELRKEYSRLRQVANKRLERMEGTRFQQSNTYKRNAGKYTTLAQIEKEALAHAKKLKPEARQKYVDSFVAHKMADMYKFLTSRTGSIQGIQRAENRAIEALRERGVTFVNKKNIQQFGDYMSYLKSLHLGESYESERALELFGIAEKKGINPEEIAADFEYWKQHQSTLEKLPKIKNENQRSAADYKRLIEKAEKRNRKKK